MCFGFVHHFCPLSPFSFSKTMYQGYKLTLHKLYCRTIFSIILNTFLGLCVKSSYNFPGKSPATCFCHQRLVSPSVLWPSSFLIRIWRLNSSTRCYQSSLLYAPSIWKTKFTLCSACLLLISAFSSTSCLYERPLLLDIISSCLRIVTLLGAPCVFSRVS